MTTSEKIAATLVESFCCAWESDAPDTAEKKKRDAVLAVAEMIGRTVDLCRTKARDPAEIFESAGAHHLELMASVSPIENARAACRATKKSIAARIRELKTLNHELSIAPKLDKFDCIWSPDQPEYAQATKNAALGAIFRTLLDVIERCAQIADSEPEFPGDPSSHHLELMKAASPEEVARTASLATRKSIIERLGALELDEDVAALSGETAASEARNAVSSRWDGGPRSGATFLVAAYADERHFVFMKDEEGTVRVADFVPGLGWARRIAGALETTQALPVELLKPETMELIVEAARKGACSMHPDDVRTKQLLAALEKIGRR